MYSVFEGRSVEACVQIFSGVADEPLLLQMVSLLAGDAEGWRPHYTCTYLLPACLSQVHYIGYRTNHRTSYVSVTVVLILGTF